MRKPWIQLTVVAVIFWGALGGCGEGSPGSLDDASVGRAGDGSNSGQGGIATGGTLSTGGAGGAVAAGGRTSGTTTRTGGIPGGIIASGGVLTGGTVASGGRSVTGGSTSTVGGQAGNPSLADAGSGGVTSQGDGGTPKPIDLSQCPPPPQGATPEAIAALNAENTARVGMGVPCAELVLTLCTAAQNHCNYYTTNQQNPACKAPSPHDEIAGCPEFTGTTGGAREKAAGYPGSGWSECMAFSGNPESAVKMFIDSVYHRTPVLSPWYRHMGYGRTAGCDTMDFGTGPATPNTVTAFFPYDGQVNVPTSFNGAQEGPTPPVPSTGWPSGYPITLFVQGLTVSTHQIVVEGTATPLSHMWLDGDATLGKTAKVLYTEAPLLPNTTYRVTIEGTSSRGPARFDWTFTTGAASGGGGGRRRG